ncbi:hypothetical protein KVR01_012471 [Diaporthe batatas]|uniref:uncharacterized protein n=1 Tax=Diaporthe batatas TaxID=748121 RepID=UPI001D05041D|nr:uncharacterized protein KVR01_012471 [Diaporthe batatas]KAG8157809.1 hypothetical protein KVR01_012471 [Diaporthe batatas]
MQCAGFSQFPRYRVEGREIPKLASIGTHTDRALPAAGVLRMDSLASGEQIQAVAYQLPSLSPKGLSFATDAVGIALGVIAIIALFLRLYVRLGFSTGLSRPLGPDDYLAAFGTLTFAAAIVFTVYATRYGLGTPDSELPSPLYRIRAAEYVMYWEQHGIPYCKLQSPYKPARSRNISTSASPAGSLPL